MKRKKKSEGFGRWSKKKRIKKVKGEKTDGKNVLTMTVKAVNLMKGNGKKVKNQIKREKSDMGVKRFERRENKKIKYREWQEKKKGSLMEK